MRIRYAHTEFCGDFIKGYYGWHPTMESQVEKEGRLNGNWDFQDLVREEDIVS